MGKKYKRINPTQVVIRSIENVFQLFRISDLIRYFQNLKSLKCLVLIYRL